MRVKKSLRGHTRALLIAAAVVALAIAVSVASAATAKPPKPTHGVKGATFTKGAKGDKGIKGNKGDKGDVGAAGLAGQVGAKGEPGAQGSPGGKGDKGDKGDTGNTTFEYGVGAVDVTRGTSTSTWAVYSSMLGSPVGDTAGGQFRFTCSATQAPCKVSLKAAALSDTSGSVTLYPRITLFRGGDPDSATTPEFYCEYGDGPTATLAKQPKSATPAYAPVVVNIGGSADCAGPDPTAGDVAQITVPKGYYDVFTTLAFKTA
jgi:hypothetical protein